MEEKESIIIAGEISQKLYRIKSLQREISKSYREISDLWQEVNALKIKKRKLMKEGK